MIYFPGLDVLQEFLSVHRRKLILAGRLFALGDCQRHVNIYTNLLYDAKHETLCLYLVVRDRSLMVSGQLSPLASSSTSPLRSDVEWHSTWHYGGKDAIDR